MEEPTSTTPKRKRSDDSDLEDDYHSPHLLRTPPISDNLMERSDFSTPRLTRTTPARSETPVLQCTPQPSSSTEGKGSCERKSSQESGSMDADAALERPPTPDLEEPDWQPFDFCLPEGIPEDLEDNEEEVESDIDEDEDWDDNKASPLYTGSPISLHESLVAILTLAIKFSLSGQAIQSILKLIHLHLPKQGNIFKKSLFLFKKYFSKVQGKFSYEYYCSKCFAKCERSKRCLKCNAALCCLVKLPLVPQLQTMFQRKGFYKKLIPLSSRKNPNGLSDVFHGQLYKDHVSSGIISDLPGASGYWYWDGASAFKSAKTSVWPLELPINELPLKERHKKENLLVAALWCGPVKPHANTVLDCVFPELEKLGAGVDIEIKGEGKKKVKFVVIGGTGDGPARDLMLNKVLQNGEFSCQKCEQKGECREGCPGVRNIPYRPAVQ